MDMKEYIYLIHPFRHEFFERPTPFEERVMEAHFEYLKHATSNGVVVLAGPCLDETFGVVVLRAESDEAARQFMLDDPSVKSNVMMAELHPMKISLKEGC
ncbi:MAG TPA: YciI family protein [Anaerolineales bacterium]|nr:YciI family protein [Anaerolineales bacterium]